MLIQTGRASGKIQIPPSIYLGGNKLNFVDCFKYLGHFITSDFKDDMDIGREVKSLYFRRNLLIRKFHYVSIEVKCALF